MDSRGVEVKGHKDPAYLARIRALGCVVCEHLLGVKDQPAAAHHLFDAHERDDYLTAALCYDHHQGPQGFHGLGGARGFQRVYKLSEADLLALTLAKLNKA